MQNTVLLFVFFLFVSFSLLSIKIYVYIINKVYRGSYMSIHVLLNLLYELKKEIKCEACRVCYLLFATSLINSIIHEHE